MVAVSLSESTNCIAVLLRKMTSSGLRTAVSYDVLQCFELPLSLPNPKSRIEHVSG